MKKSLIASISLFTISGWLMMRGRRKLVRVSEFELFPSTIRRHLSKASLLGGRNTRRNMEPEVHDGPTRRKKACLRVSYRSCGLRQRFMLMLQGFVWYTKVVRWSDHDILEHSYFMSVTFLRPFIPKSDDNRILLVYQRQ